MTQEPDRVIEESQLREILLRAYQLKCAEVESLTVRLAAQSGYAENEAQADLQAALIAQYDAILAAVNSFRETAKCCDVLCDWCKYDNRLVDTILNAIAKHDSRKGAE